MKPSEAEAHEAANRIAARYADEDTSRLAELIDAEERERLAAMTDGEDEWNRQVREMIDAENAEMVRVSNLLRETL